MKRLLTILTMLFVMVCAGCGGVPIVTAEKLEHLKAQWKEPKVSTWYYIGTRESYHYFRHWDLDGTKTYRISEIEQKMENPFPLTSEHKSWRVMYWGVLAHMNTKEKEWELNTPSGPR